MPAVKRPSRRLAATGAACAAFAGSLVLAGCSERSPIQSVVQYQPTDGVAATISDLSVRNLLVVSSGQGEPGVLSGALLNSGTSDVDVTFTVAGDAAPSAPVPVPPGQLVQIGPGDGAVHVQFPTVAAPPGAMLTVQVSTPATGATRLDVPVLPPTLEYSTITPTAEPTATDTASPTGSPTTASG
jgi:hypothetical protein